MSYTPSAQAIAATALLNTNLTTCPAPGPFAATTATGATALPFQCVVDALIPVIEAIPTLPGTWLVSSKAADFTAAVWTRYAVNTTIADVTATLPAASTCAGKGIFFKKIASANNMVIASTDLIDGSAALTYTALWSPLTLYSTGATWYTA